MPVTARNLRRLLEIPPMEVRAVRALCAALLAAEGLTLPASSRFMVGMRWPVRTLLHLTDLHFGATDGNGHYWSSESPELALPSHDQRGLLGSLTRDLRQQQLKPDLVVVSGDLLDKAAATGIQLALDFLRGLCAKLSLPSHRVVLVPGNHDVCRVSEPTEKYLYFDRIWSEFYGSARPVPNATIAPYHRVHFFDYGGDLGIEVVGFNSCESLDPTTNQHHGSVGAAQRDLAEELLEPNGNNERFRIAVMHHHLVRPVGIVREDYSVMDDAELILRWLAGRHFHLVLHGHQHFDWDDKREIGGWLLSVVAGASAGVASYGRKDWMLQLGYQVIVIDNVSSGRRIRREFDPQTREWIAAGKGATEQPLRFGPVAPGMGTVPTMGEAITATAVKALLFRRLKLWDEINLFFTAYFPDVKPYLKTGEAPANWFDILLTQKTPQEIYEALCTEFPDVATRSEGGNA